MGHPPGEHLLIEVGVPLVSTSGEVNSPAQPSDLNVRPEIIISRIACYFVPLSVGSLRTLV